MPIRLVLYGAGHAFALKTAYAIDRAEPTFGEIVFLDDDPDVAGTRLVDVPVIGGRELLPDLAADGNTVFFNNVMGHWTRRREVADLLAANGCRLASLIDPRIDVLDLRHGEGVFIGAFANFGHSARLGDHAVVMQSVVLGDETVVGDRAFLANLAAVGSRSVVGEDAFVGPNSVTIPDCRIGSRAVVGAGATVVHDVPDDVRVINQPAVPG